ncbi:unnamed protein product [Heterobilharzia americana]|nr:unnamed protein product [Heterobilharzia americana]
MSLRYWKFTSSLSLSKRVYLCRIPVEFITSNLHQAYFTHHLQYKSIHSVEVKDGNTSIQSIKTIQQCNSDQAICENIKLIGWVQSVRKHKSHVFCNISDGSSPYNLQVVMTPSQITNKITIGCALSIEGDIHPIPNILNKFQSSNRTPNTQCCGELHAKSVTILDCVKQPNELQTNELTDDSSLIHKKNVTTVNQVVSSIGRHSPRPDFGILRSIEGLSTRHKLPEFAAMLRMRAHIKQLVRKVMNSCNYLEVDTPILTTCSNAFGIACFGLSKVYTLNPTFRAENRILASSCRILYA